ncbi:NADP-dependent oxidoreductase [Nocardia jinanensis]|uniref:Oxidoreductase n=1 Tax=Nocardia jinanensis TaxID=382504 RepID=A0A917VUF9_9NOCA|nr:NADP-dependent oxidoreductase [Nocardia jinanensis]GGL15262.1 oxidoreductase [Nocardia jinanensis]
MRAVRFHEYGDPEILTVDQTAEPHAGPGEIRIRAIAAGVNPVDWKIRAGLVREFMPVELPGIIGQDAAGIVDEVGDGVTTAAVGDEVFGLAATGGTAEFVVLSAWASKPAGWSWEQAAGAGVVVETATRSLDLLGVAEDMTVLIDGAAGGVGTAAIQLALARGARVIGTAGSANHELLRSPGAMPTTYGAGLAERVAALAPEGVDAALDTVGAGSVPELITLVPAPAQVVSIADPSATEHGAHMTSGETVAAHGLAEAARLAAAGRFTIPIDSVFDLQEAADAHHRSQTGHAHGKVVIRIQNP